MPIQRVGYFSPISIAVRRQMLSRTVCGMSCRHSTVSQFSGFTFWGVVERRPDGTVHRTVLAGPGLVLKGQDARGVSDDKPARTREERLVSLALRSKNGARADPASIAPAAL
jgi:hypothetical protein